MAYSRLFLDSDVILDIILKRQPFVLYMQELLMQCASRGLELTTSTLVIANMNYILTKEFGAPESKKRLKEIIKVIDVLSFEGEIVGKAIESRFSDLEDAFQHLIAVRNNCDLIITRNVKDYKHSIIPVLTPEQFLKTL